MENTNYVGLSYQVALERKMDTISNNIANVDTPGFKSSHMLFDEYVVEARNQKPMSMVLDKGQYRNAAPGAITQTGNPFDVAIAGEGFFAVSTPGGEKYTRNGSFRVDNLGQLVTSFNMPVAGESGGAITIPPDAKDISIAEDGTISSSSGQLGRLKVVRFENAQNMKPVGNSMYETGQSPVKENAGKVNQGVVEGSNVNSVMEMTDMIEVLRRYQSMAQLLQNNHNSQLSMIQKLSQA